MSPCFHYTNHLFVFYIVRIWLKSFTLDFQSFPSSPDCNVFDSACTDNSSFLCSSSVYLMQISWIFVCRASLRQVTASIDALRLLLFHAYYFCASIFQRTTSQILSEPLPMQDCSCPDYLLYKVVDLPLHRSRYTRNGISKRVWLRWGSNSRQRWLGINLLYPLSYSAILERTNQLKIRSVIHRCELS